MIEHHREQIRIYKKRGAELAAKLEQERLRELYKTVLEEGCDIAALNAAIKNGEINLKTVENETSEISDAGSDVTDDMSSISVDDSSEFVRNTTQKDERDSHNNFKEDRH